MKYQTNMIQLAERLCGYEHTHEMLDDSELRSDLRHIRLGVERKEITVQDAETLEKEARGRFDERKKTNFGE